MSDDPTPTRLDVRKARAAERAAAEQTYRVAADRLPRRVRGIARDEAGKVARRIGLWGAVLAALLSIAIALAAYSTADRAADSAAATRETVSTALERLDAANDTLQARGQVPVPPPATADDPTAAITAAVLAQVLASLPPSPTADDVAARVQSAVTASVLGPATGELTRLVAEYFATNPPQPGPPPTQAQIDAAVARAIAADPPRDGTDGQSPPCLSTPAMCVGEDGTNGTNGVDGAPGRSVTAGPQPVRLDDGTCVWRVQYSADPLVEEFPAGDAACPGGGVLGLGLRR